MKKSLGIGCFLGRAVSKSEKEKSTQLLSYSLTEDNVWTDESNFH
jgi:hypothetical protein